MESTQFEKYGHQIELSIGRGGFSMGSLVHKNRKSYNIERFQSWNNLVSDFMNLKLEKLITREHNAMEMRVTLI